MTPDHAEYLPQLRAERVITAGRLLLALLLVVAVEIDPVTSGRYVVVLQRVSLAYLVYAALVAAFTWSRQSTPRDLPLITHVLDLALFSGLMYFSAAPTSPFFVYLIFSMVCGAIRWHGRGALLTGSAALLVYVSLTIAGRMSELIPYQFERTRFITRCAHLMVTTGLLAYLGSHQRRLQKEIASLAAWPRRLPADAAAALHDVLSHAAAVLRVPRVVLVWQEGEEPSLQVAESGRDGLELSRERPDVFGTLVHERLEHSSFFCDDASGQHCLIVYRVPGGFESFRGGPLDDRFRRRFDVKSVLALRIATDNVEGRLIALDRPFLLIDDILLGDIVGRLVASALEQQALMMQLRDAAASEERLRLARELHDGVMQSLTALGMQIDRLRALPDLQSPEVQRRLVVMEDAITTEHRSLREMLEDLHPGRRLGVNPTNRLKEVTSRLERQWEVRITTRFAPNVPALSAGLVHELSRMTEEAVINAIRHGGAEHIHVELEPDPDQQRLRLGVSYKGRGFVAFAGSHDLASLSRMGAGPRTLMERAAALNGDLTVHSDEGGATLEIHVPTQGTM